jgi:hypothetical protein
MFMGSMIYVYELLIEGVPKQNGGNCTSTKSTWPQQHFYFAKPSSASSSATMHIKSATVRW